MIARILSWAQGGSVMPWLLAGAIAVAGILGGLAGVQVATWRADAAHAGVVRDLNNEIETLTDEKNRLILAIEKQNAALEAAKAQTQAINSAKAQAQIHAADLAKFSQSRLDKLQLNFATDTTCDAVLKRYWELRQ